MDHPSNTVNPHPDEAPTGIAGTLPPEEDVRSGELGRIVARRLRRLVARLRQSTPMPEYLGLDDPTLPVVSALREAERQDPEGFAALLRYARHPGALDAISRVAILTHDWPWPEVEAMLDRALAEWRARQPPETR